MIQEFKQLRININQNSKFIVKKILLLKASLFLILAIAAIYWSIDLFFVAGSVAFFFFAIIPLIFLIIAIKFFEKSFFQEYILVEKEKIEIVQQSLLNKEIHRFLVSEITLFDFVGAENFTNNAMHNPVFDITGLQASEKEVQYLIDRGTVLIETQSTTFRFGKNLPSWEADEIIDQIETYLNQSFPKLKMVQANESTEIS
jgi:hypothetical protein